MIRALGGRRTHRIGRLLSTMFGQHLLMNEIVIAGIYIRILVKY
jgi:uncharacterized membrane protein YciS (DUF1049 family)